MMRMKNYGRALLLGSALALAACSGSNGSNGANGADGAGGTNGTNGVNGVAGKWSLSIDAVQTVGTTSTVTFTIRPAAAVCPGSVCDANLASLGQKTFYAQEFNATNNTFDTAKNFSFSGYAFKGYSADGNGAQYTAKKTGASWAPEASASAYVYGYVATKGVVPAPTTGHYSLPQYVASAAKVFGAAVTYASNANVAGCEKCHGAPYSKHGYRQAKVAGLPDFVSCKVCHTDQRVGSDANWYMIADDPALLYTTLATNNGSLTDAQKAKYAYTANIMNDVHNSHAFEFNYPQSMANCVTCHAGKLTAVINDANFKPTVCKSCHPVTGVNGTEAGRAPAMKALWAASSYGHAGIDMYTASETACSGCHVAGGAGPTFATLHKGFNDQIYADAASANAGTKFSAARKVTVGAVSYDAASFVGTLAFSVSGVSTTAAVVNPTVVASLYGYDTKDFLVSGHGTHADGKRNLEWTNGSSSNGTRLVVAQNGADTSSFVVSFNLSTWSSMLGSAVKRIEIGVLPTIGVDPTLAISTTSNPAAVVTGATQTIDVTVTAANAKVASPYGKAITDVNKCNACHDALGTTFHNPNYGSAGTPACRLCHVVASPGSHLEMQSRSIDSYVHAIHRMQAFDIKNVNLNNPAQAQLYGDKVEGNYPNFAGPLNCESCHNAGTYDVPDQTKSMVGILSASSAFAGGTRNVGAYAGEITGPAARACGACHRAAAINEDDAAKLAAFVSHTNDFSSFVATTSTQPFLDTAAYVQSLVKGGTATPVAGARVEECTICHPTSGSDHQALFNVWKNGL